MPVKSKAQARFMGAVASGDIKKPGLSKAKAQEFLDATPSGKKLPERKGGGTSGKKESKKRR